MDRPDPNKDYLTTTQAARLLAVSPDTVLKWVRAGKVKSYRTLGGHFRIPTGELGVLGTTKSAHLGAVEETTPVMHQYCWEFLAAGGEIKPECRDCITFRSRARRCYELKELPGGLGCLNLMCDTSCTDCEYYKLVHGQGLNVLILTGSSSILKSQEKVEQVEGLRVKFCVSEYDAAVAIQYFRPDYVVVDCAFGKKRTGSICNSLFGDIRIPVARIILSSRSRDIDDYCDREVFGWIRKPFDLEQLRQCIRGVPSMADNQ
ncbi:MAG: helix-turn-helix domain-containing protein [Candidatus Zixiibacteriota bacterium]